MKEVVVVNNLVTEIGSNGKGKDIIQYAPYPRTTVSEITGGFEEKGPITSDVPTMGEEIDKEFAGIYSFPAVTGGVEKVTVSVTKTVVEVLDSAINLLDEVLEIYDDEIERVNTFSLLEEKIKTLWVLREETNQNFVDVLVLLEVAVRNSHYQNYKKTQYQAIKRALEEIKRVHITTQKTKECRNLLMDNDIDLFAPIRNWENYTIEIKKKDESL